MKLFRSDNETENSELETKIIRDKNKVAVISANSHVQNEVGSILKMHNIGNVVSKKLTINDYREDESTLDAGWYIIDIETEKDLSIINDIVVMAIPNDVMYILIGETDSIAFSSELLKIGAKYLYKETQLGTVADIILNTKGRQADRLSLNVSFLGCKGGCGTTTVASRAFFSIEKFITTPVLFIQGASGSRDLDLIASDKNEISVLEGKIQKITAMKSVKIDSDIIRFDYSNPVYQQYNINIFDHNISRASPEDLEIVFNNTGIIVLVIGNNFSSLRTAKRIIDEYKKFESRSKIRPKRIITCVNEYEANSRRDKFSNDDAEDFLEREIDLRFPILNTEKKSKEFNEKVDILNSKIFAKEISRKTPAKSFFSWVKLPSRS
ncbi:hypothetical protein EZX49_11850 [Salmonella enterica subsp. enterica serovar Indiana]|uniref:hypothetical protein n=1 Tax=Salmonella enterica TaxID=28901 RepID=UPI0007D6E073|nr:hypothetical protein [Salmonella enterica]EAA5917994.1 hypothetical protein [Salmonella enterica subsp. enterica serovar Newport]EAB6919946.1 hypothetical protein [Salmonella enterica subsp. enterica serovar Stanley]EBM9870334.1 hypothetical protein [Salmonella enterica subsp. enterica serovar Senftenberg]EBS4496507.1 hypothetical protein [Salmonella enterica subsp. enterica serovar Agona]EBU8601783.1 hypothetical protein [Salmonella enterica subsp. enterica serovar Chester]EBV2761978.1 hy